MLGSQSSKSGFVVFQKSELGAAVLDRGGPERVSYRGIRKENSEVSWNRPSNFLR